MVNFSYFRTTENGTHQETEMVERDRRAKFVELANKRTHSVVKGLKLIGNLSSRANYKWDEEDARKIFSTIRKELRVAETRFRGADSDGKKEEFKVVEM